MNLVYTYAGIVEVVRDPLKLGRLKVRVPQVYGISAGGDRYIGTNDLPWALPAGLPAGGSPDSGGFSHLPAKGDKVWVRFLDGEPEKPIWEWAMQSVDDRDTLKLNSYGEGTPVGDPDHAFWTRYAHAIEINQGAIIATTSQGYRIVLTDGSDAATMDGNIMVTTPHGNFVQFDDLDDTAKLSVLEDLYFNVGSAVIGTSDQFSWTTMSDDFSVDSGAAFNVTARNNIGLTTAQSFSVDALSQISLTSTGSFQMGFSTLQIGLAATEAAVKGTTMVEWISSLFLWLATHTHTSATPGSPTSPALQPTVEIQPLPEQLLSTTITLQS